MIDETLDFIRNGGALVRYHTVQVLQRQTIAEHSFHVAMLVWWLQTAPNPTDFGMMLMAGLTHDLAEHKVGDLPAPVKRSLPGFTDDVSFRDHWDGMEQSLLEPHELHFMKKMGGGRETQRILKLADAAEGCLYCCREREMGNRLITECYKNFHEYVSGLVTDRPREQALLDHIDAAWERACGYQGFIDYQNRPA